MPTTPTTVRITITDADGTVFAIHSFDDDESVAALKALITEATPILATEYEGTPGDNAARTMLDDIAAACEAE